MPEVALAGAGEAEVASSTPPVRSRRISARVGFAAAVVVLAVFLAIGSGVGSSAPPTLAQRAAAIEAVIKCPSCDGISVEESEASPAIAVRLDIVKLLKQGETATQIEDTLVTRYGSVILLSPPDSGLSLVVWILPAIAGAGVLGGIGWLFWRRDNEFRRLRRGQS